MNTSKKTFAYFSNYVLLFLAIFLALFLPSLILGGVTWDELFDFEGVNGSFWHGINFLKGANPDLSTITFDLEYFGNATRWPTYFFWRLTNTIPWESFQGMTRDAVILASNYVGLNHLNAAFFGFLGILLTGFLGFLLAGNRLMALSATLLLLLPTWLGHSWMNSKDIPIAASYLLYTVGSTYLFLPSIKQSPDKSKTLPSHQILRALGICLLLGSRIGSVSFIIITELIYLLLLRGKHLRGCFFSLVVGMVAAFVLTPQGWGDPIRYPLDAVEFISNRQGANSSWDTLVYISWHLFDSLPLIILFGLFLLALSLFSGYVARRSYFLPWLPIVLQATIAPALLVLGSKSLYNELRHIEFIYPAVCIFSGLGYTKLFSFISRNSRAKIILVPLSGLLLGLVLEILLLSPYQYIYRSDISRVLFAGTPIHRDYWGFSVRETFVRAIKNPAINSADLSASTLRKGDWNQALFDGYIGLLSASQKVSGLPSVSNLELQVSPATNHCESIVETRRWVLLPTPSLQLISRYADCA